MRSKYLVLSAAFTAVAVFATPAAAQDGIEAVVVSASRISLEGYQAPTPVTQITSEKIERAAKIDIGDLIRELPATGPSPSLNNGGKDNGAPGMRPYHPGYYAAFLLDPEGNNIEIVFHGDANRSAPSVKITF